MRLLHTSDWHLGRQIRGLSRQAEFETVLGEVADIAVREKVDLLLVAGDIFDTFSPPPDAEKLLYETLEEALRAGVQVALLAGNHDHAGHMDALTGILRLAGIHSFGGVPATPEQASLRFTTRDKSETVNLVALPWVPERFAFDFEALSGEPAAPIQQYADRMEVAIRRFWGKPDPKEINIFAAHALIDGAIIGPGGGERPIQIGQAFAVKAAALPADAQYIALGHIHKPQQIAAASRTQYSGSLLQLDFGEANQKRGVNLVELHPGLPADPTFVPLSGGRQLKNITVGLADLAAEADKHGDAYLKVTVDLALPVMSLYQQVKDALPNAVEVIAHLPLTEADPSRPAERHGLQPAELFERFYRERRGQDISPELLKLFTALYSEASENAPA